MGRALWLGHLLRFDKEPTRPGYGPATGASLLLTAGGLEASRLVLGFFELPFAPNWVAVPLLLGVALLSIRVLCGVAWAEIGLRPWPAWNATEKAYFIQVVLIANVVFPVVFATRLLEVFGAAPALTTIATVFVPYLMFGFYQEVLYRGVLQTELVRRLGPTPGVLASNLFYTFGPLHYEYFSSAASSAALMFAAVFAMGLLFAMIFRRSGNLWIVAVMHGIGNAYIVGSLGSMR